MNNRMDRTKTKKLSVSGIMLALTVICLFFAVILPTSRLSLYVLSSFPVAIIIIEYGIKAGWAFYISSSLLSVFIVQNKVGMLPYIVFFGVYGIIKFYIEKLHSLLLEYILKYVSFNLCVAVTILFMKNVAMLDITIKFPWWIFIVALEVIFLIYDYVYTLFIQYYNNKLRSRLGL